MRCSLTLISGLIFILSACDNTSMDDRVNYDKTAFLENTVDNLIIPAFDDFDAKADVLNTEYETFEAEPTEENLQNLQNALRNSWLSYQYVAYLQIGPSAELFFRDELNIFPADTLEIERKISEAEFELTGSTNLDVKGFPAIDFLINGLGDTDAEIVSNYSSGPNATARFTYLSNLVSQIQQIANTINNSLPAYRNTFLEASGTDIGSSTGKLVNEFNLQFDLRLKNGKIGIPSGVKSLERTNPGKVECYYGEYSKDLALASAQAALDIFKGVHFMSATDGEGLDDYLNALDAGSEEEMLSAEIINAIQLSIDNIESIQPSIKEASQTFNSEGELVASYNALQAVIPLIKVDMTSKMGVTITFQDNDGD